MGHRHPVLHDQQGGQVRLDVEVQDSIQQRGGIAPREDAVEDGPRIMARHRLLRGVCEEAHPLPVLEHGFAAVPREVPLDKTVERQTDYSPPSLCPQPPPKGPDHGAELCPIPTTKDVAEVRNHIARIPREQFIPAVTREDHPHLVRGELRDVPLGDYAGADTWLVSCISTLSSKRAPNRRTASSGSAISSSLKWRSQYSRTSTFPPSAMRRCPGGRIRTPSKNVFSPNTF